MPSVYCHKYPDVPQIVVTAIGICAEFGADFPRTLSTVIFRCLKTAMEHILMPKPRTHHGLYEAAVFTYVKLNQIVSLGIRIFEFILLWLNHSPVRCYLDEAKFSHELLCSMVETSEEKVIGPDGAYMPMIIIAIFADVLWAGNKLATEEKLSIF